MDINKTKIQSNQNFSALKKYILECFTKKSMWYRKELITACIKKVGLSESQLKDNSYDSIYTKWKSFIGSVISQMTIKGDLFLTTGKELFLKKDITIILKEDEVEEYLGFILQKFGQLTKKELYEHASVHFQTNLTSTSEDDRFLNSTIDKLLETLMTSKIVIKENNKYKLKENAFFPNSLIGTCLQDVYNGKDLLTNLHKVISIKGGEFFESFAVKILEEYYKFCHYEIIHSQVTGGSNDNGIDGRLEITNLLGHHQIILMQAKARMNAQVTLKEVREFYGVLKCEEGQLGIFMTNSTYHKEAIRFASKLKDLLLIDIKKLLVLAELNNVGIIVEGDKKLLDSEIFIYERF